MSSRQQELAPARQRRNASPYQGERLRELRVVPQLQEPTTPPIEFVAGERTRRRDRMEVVADAIVLDVSAPPRWRSQVVAEFRRQRRHGRHDVGDLATPRVRRDLRPPRTAPRIAHIGLGTDLGKPRHDRHVHRLGRYAVLARAFVGRFRVRPGRGWKGERLVVNRGHRCP
jgi:hypothetical protein